MSDYTARIIDQEVRKLIEDCEASAHEILTAFHDQWEAIAQALLEYETLTGDEIRGLMEGQLPLREADTEPVPRVSSVPSTGQANKKRSGPDAAPEGGAPEPQPGS